MRDRPEGVTDPALARALANGWGLAGWTLQYAPVGAGSYHWTAAGDTPGERRFVTVDDLDDKAWLGRTRPAVLAGLRTAMDAAAALHQAGLGFVVAPEPALTGETVRPLGARHAVTVFPFLAGPPGDWGELLTAPERGELVAMLAALHRADPAAVRLPCAEPRLPWRGDLEMALAELGQPWTGGPYAELARALLAGAAGPVRRHLNHLDRRSAILATAQVVVTHGEPHPANIIRLPSTPNTPNTPSTPNTPNTPNTVNTSGTFRTTDTRNTTGTSRISCTFNASGTTGTIGTAGDAHRAGARLALIDWDTAALAPPERDLWLVATESGDELRLYAELTGRPVDPAAVEFYRLRWALDDLSCFVRDLRAPHRRTRGAEDNWQALETTIADLTR